MLNIFLLFSYFPFKIFIFLLNLFSGYSLYYFETKLKQLHFFLCEINEYSRRTHLPNIQNISKLAISYPCMPIQPGSIRKISSGTIFEEQYFRRVHQEQKDSNIFHFKSLFKINIFNTRSLGSLTISSPA